MSIPASPASGPTAEPIWTIVFGFLLGTLGFVSYTGGVPYFGSGHSASFTPWIPSWVGTPLILLGLLALNERYLKHAMHAAAMIGLLGAIAALVPLGIKAAKGNWDERPEATHSEVAMLVLCGAFVVVCVRSFIAARRRRRVATLRGSV